MSEALNTTTTGEVCENPFLIAHGLFGTARNWGVLAKRFAVQRQILTVDMRNHGESFSADSNTYFDMADDLAKVIETVGAADVMGHSMGGKAAMVLALTRPELVNRLVIADIAPVGYSHSQSDKITAMKSVDLTKVSRRRDADLQLAETIADPMLRAFLLQSLNINPDGPASWKLNLDALQNAMDDIIGFPDLSGQFTGQVLFLHGGASDYVQPAHHAKIRSLFPNAVFEVIEGAGHWLHAENPRAFEGEVNRFLS